MNFKSFYSLALVVLLSILFTACSTKPNKVLPKKDGKWSVATSSKITITGMADQISSSTGTATFTDDGKVVFQETGSTTTETNTWSYDDDAKKMTINKGAADEITYTVTEATRKSEKWNSTYSETNAGITSTFTIDVTLTR